MTEPDDKKEGVEMSESKKTSRRSEAMKKAWKTRRASGDSRNEAKNIAEKVKSAERLLAVCRSHKDCLDVLAFVANQSGVDMQDDDANRMLEESVTAETSPVEPPPF